MGFRDPASVNHGGKRISQETSVRRHSNDASSVSYPSSSPYYDQFHNQTLPLLLFEPLLVETRSRTSPLGLLGMRFMLTQSRAKSMTISGREAGEEHKEEPIPRRYLP